MKIPQSIEEVTPAWLSRVLKTPVRACTPVQIVDGYMSDVYRVRLDADTLSSVIIKMSAADPDRRALAERYDAYTKEIKFYQRDPATHRFRTPECYYCEIDAAGHVLICLEDVQPATRPDQTIGATLPQTLSAIEAIAHVHEQSVGRADTPSFIAGFAAAAEELKHFDITPFLQASPATTLIAQYLNHAAQYQQLFTDQPQTFSHMDFRLDNLVFTQTGVVILDWGEYSLAPVGFDLAYFLITSVNGEHRRLWEEQALACYRGSAGADGETISHDSLLASYQLSLLPSVYLAMLALRSGQDGAYGKVLLQRLQLAVSDHLEPLTRMFNR